MEQVGCSCRTGSVRKKRIEIQNLIREKAEVTLPTEPILEVEIQGETDAQWRNRG